jgi:hypothetical protein
MRGLVEFISRIAFARADSYLDTKIFELSHQNEQLTLDKITNIVIL